MATAKGVELFAELFQGRTSAYGVHIPDANPAANGKKRKGKSFTRNEALTQDLYEQHIQGNLSLGIVPLREDNTVKFAAIDIDVYPVNVRHYCNIFDGYGLPFTCFTSKSGGLHCFIFFKHAVPAQKVIPLLREVVAIIGLPATTEIFPKQGNAQKVGNWINLPYYNADHTTRGAFDLSGKPLPFDTAMELCIQRRVTLEQLEDALAVMPLHDGPPCLQSLLVSGEVNPENHNRNIFLFNACAYCKQASPEGYSQDILRLNQMLTEPLPREEVEGTILSSYARGNYSYKCSESWLSQYCRKDVCYKRRFGKQRADIMGLNFGELRQILTDPPYYEWDINGVACFFHDEEELSSFRKVNNYCIRHLHKSLPPIKAADWVEILNSALTNIVVVERPLTYRSASPQGILRGHLKEFLTNRVLARNIAQVFLGLVFKDRIYGYVFRLNDFTNWLSLSKSYRLQNTTDISVLLSNIGATTKTLEIKGSRITVWMIPAETIEQDFTIIEEDILHPDQFQCVQLEDLDPSRANMDLGFTDEDLTLRENF